MQARLEAARAVLLEALNDVAAAEPAIEGLWLQGSLARGDADPFSDIDAYLAIGDADFERVWTQRRDLLARFGEVLAWSDATTPGLRAVHVLMAGGARLDLFFEAASKAADAPRPVVKPLVDKTGVVARLRPGWQPPAPTIGRIVQTIIRMTRQGATWPLRVLGRGQWSTLAMMELDLINAQLAQLLAVRRETANFYRNSFSLALVLTEDERSRLDALTAAVLAAIVARDPRALKAVHLQLLDALVEAGREACAALAVDYPISAAEERAVRELVDREWPA